MKRNPIFPLPTSALEQMPTKQLLARLKRLRQCEESFSLSDRNENNLPMPNTIEFKQTPEWAAAYAQVKEILAQREHIPNRAKLRTPRAQKSKTILRHHSKPNVL